MLNKTKSAFTLAEVLITLVIIGIVAALTISAVINTYVERSTVAKVKKGLSILGQAKKLAEAQNGPVIGWDFEGTWSTENNQKFFNYLKPYISLSKDCGTAAGCYSSSVYQLNGNLHSQSYGTNNKFYKFVLADGSVMWFGASISGGKCGLSYSFVNNICATFFYDINGDKKPNTIGKDIFTYYIAADGVFPSDKNECHKNSTGFGCTTYIIQRNNMNYLH